jgi:uncharacterized protein YozE (UPF0346 family)
VKEDLASVLLGFYQEILKPEFDAIKGKMVEHDEQFSEVMSRFDSIYNQLSRLEDACLMLNNR